MNFIADKNKFINICKNVNALAQEESKQDDQEKSFNKVAKVILD